MSRSVFPTLMRDDPPVGRWEAENAGLVPPKHRNGGATATTTDNMDGDERAIVAVRVRPLNSKETTKSPGAGRVWRVPGGKNAIVQTTASGARLPKQERQNGKTTFTFDRVFDESSSTMLTYDSIARGVVRNVFNGLNGTIFAYGQTSSGKTHTMQGDGSEYGVVHMAARDIFDHIAADRARVFLLRVSFIEIYNEEVRDLLGPHRGSERGAASSANLTIREDPRRGVYVNANESIVTDFDSLMSVLLDGQKNRTVGSTSMNERSSRSHTIFRITVESRKKWLDGDYRQANKENSFDSFESPPAKSTGAYGGDVNGDDEAVLVSTLNLVDLAGSESARHTGATGRQLKEGGKINQSLLTLSRVIVGLGQQKSKHINFRDSKLTRILQTSLSGNARIAIVCCVTPSELYLEETRSTLQFASRAMMVKTRAQVNEVLDDRSLIKRLQKDLADARRSSNLIMSQMHEQNNGTTDSVEAAAKSAEEKLKRLKAAILNGGVLEAMAPVSVMKRGVSQRTAINYINDPYKESSRSHDASRNGRAERRHSDEILYRTPRNNSPRKLTLYHTPDRRSSVSEGFLSSPNSKKRRRIKKGSVESARSHSWTSSTEVDLLREALEKKSHLASSLKRLVNSYRADLDKAHHRARDLQRSKEVVDDQLKEHKEALAQKDNKLGENRKELEFTMVSKESTIKKYEKEVATLQEERRKQTEENSTLAGRCHELEIKSNKSEREVRRMKAQVQKCSESLDVALTAKTDAEATTQAVRAEVAHLRSRLASLKGEKEQLATENMNLRESHAAQENKHMNNFSASLRNVKTEYEDALAASRRDLSTVQKSVSDLSKTNSTLAENVRTYREQINILQNQKDVLVSTNAKNNALLASLRGELSSLCAKNEEHTVNINGQESLISKQSGIIQNTEAQLKTASTELNAYKEEIDILQHNNGRLSKLKTENEDLIASLRDKVSSLSTENKKQSVKIKDQEGFLSEQSAALQSTEAQLTNTRNKVRTLSSTLEKFEDDQQTASNMSIERLKSLQQEVLDLTMVNEDLVVKSQAYDSKINAYEEEIKTLQHNNGRLSKLKTENDDLIASLRDKVSSLSTENKKQSVKIKNQDGFLSEQSAALQSTEAQLTNTRNKVRTLSSTLETFEADQQTASNMSIERLKSLQQKVLDLTMVNEDLVVKSQAYDSKINILEDLKESLTKSSLEKDVTNDYLSCEVSSLRQKIEWHEKQTQSIEAELKRALRENEELSGQHEEAKMQLSDSKRDLDNLLRERQKTMDEFQSSISQLKEEKDHFKQVQEESCLLVKKIKGDLKATLLQMRGKDSLIDEQSNRIAKIDSELMDAHNRVSELTTQVETTNAQQKKLTANHDQLLSDHMESQKAISQLKKQNEESLREIDEISNKLEIKSFQVAMLTNESQQLQDEKMKIEKDLENKILYYEATNRAAVDRNNELSNTIRSCERRKKSLLMENTNLKKQSSELIDQVEISKNQMDGLFSDKLSLNEKATKFAQEKDDLFKSKCLLDQKLEKMRHDIEQAGKEKNDLLGSVESSQKQLQHVKSEKENLEALMERLEREKDQIENRIAYLERRRFFKRLTTLLKSL